MTAPLVSVLIPCFRSAAYVHRALDSVLAQTRDDWEAVVVDNASDDGTYELAEGYARRDPRVRAFRNDENLGPVRNWRCCAELARGTYAGLLFSDDWYEPGFLATTLPLLAPADIGIVYSAVRMRRKDRDGNIDQGHLCYQLEGAERHLSLEYLKPALVHGGPAVPVSPGCALARTADLRRWLDVDLPDEEIRSYLRHGAGPDVWVYLQACRDYPAFGHVPVPMVNFLAHDSNLSGASEILPAYAAALLHFYDRHAPIAGLSEQRVLANLRYRLRRDPIRQQLSRRLRLLGWFETAFLSAVGALWQLLRKLLMQHRT